MGFWWGVVFVHDCSCFVRGCCFLYCMTLRVTCKRPACNFFFLRNISLCMFTNLTYTNRISYLCDMHCVMCALLTCVPGHYSSGCIAGSTRDAVCLQCRNRPSVGLFEWKKDCIYLCANGYHRVNNTLCMQCREKNCSPGFYSSGCSDSSDNMCMPCVAHSSGHATWTTGCNFICDDGYVYNPARGCIPCDAPGADGTYVWTGSNCSFSCLYNRTNSSVPCLAVSPTEPMALVSVDTALYLNNTANMICSELDVLLQALSKSIERMNSCKCIRFITNITSFDGVPCISDICPQCRNSTLLTTQRRLFGSGVRLVTLSTSINPAPVSLIQHTDSMQHSVFVQAELNMLLPAAFSLLSVVALVSRVVMTPVVYAAPSSVGLIFGVVVTFAVVCCIMVCAVVPKPRHCRVEEVREKKPLGVGVSDRVSWMKGVRLLKRRSKSRERVVVDV